MRMPRVKNFECTKAPVSRRIPKVAATIEERLKH
jgi:hypothetical protein